MRLAVIITIILFAIGTYFVSVNVIENIKRNKEEKIAFKKIESKIDSLLSINAQSIDRLRYELDSIYRDVGVQVKTLKEIDKIVQDYKVPRTKDGILKELKRLAND